MKKISLPIFYIILHFFLLLPLSIGNVKDSSPEQIGEDQESMKTKSREETRIVIVREETRLFLYEENKLIRTYIVAVGNAEMGKATPSGRFKIVSKVKDPVMVWRSGKVIPPNDPRNSYGARWIGLVSNRTGKYRGCGIQGTNTESSIGKKITVGSVRMYNKDIIELFDLVELGTEVVIR